MKKIFNYLLLIIVMLFPICVKGIEIESVDIAVNVDKNGTAHVTETWNNPVSKSNATEFYKAYDNLDGMNITNFKVNYNNKDFDYKSNWNINASFEDKSNKNGIYYENNKVELCWGVTNYESGTYVLTYDIEGFVLGLTDSDIIYFNFISSGNEIGDFYLKLNSDFYFDKDLPVWGYGKRGVPTYVYDGYIEIKTENKIDNSEYITMLVKFDKGTFDTSNVSDKDFKYYSDMAEEGAIKYQSNDSTTSGFLNTLLPIISVLAPILLLVFVAFIITKSSKSRAVVGGETLLFGKNGRVIPKNIPNIREIPFDKDIYMTYWVALSYSISSKKTDFLGAILLKWMLTKKITLQKQEVKKLFKTAEESVIILPENPVFDNLLELDLYKMLYEASHNGILESHEFESWCRDNYDRILGWFDDVAKEENKKLISTGKIHVEEKRTFKIFKSNTYNVDPSMIKEAIKLKGFKNFLDEFSRIDDKEAIEVNMWEYYLIYAQILGIANKVAKQFKKLYPEIIENNEYGYSYDDFLFISAISYSGINSAVTSRSRAESYSAGGGGFSSGGGGGGAFGSGGSMGSR